MIILKESVTVKPGGYMLSKYGDIIDVKYHPYGIKSDNIYDIQYNAACSFFLYIHNKSYRDKAIITLKNYISAIVEESDLVTYDTLDYVGEDAKELLFDIFDEQDIDNDLCDWSNDTYDTKNILYELVKDKSIGDIIDELDDNNNGLQDYITLNQLYTRFRIGGEYDNTNENEIYFRISSVGYDWGKDIVDVMFKYYNNIKFITIERDKESCELMNKDYRIYSLNGVPINHYPVKDFIYVEKPPILSAAVVRTCVGQLLYNKLLENTAIFLNTNNSKFIYENIDILNDIENHYVTERVGFKL